MGNGDASFISRVFRRTKVAPPIEAVIQDRKVRIVFQPIVDLEDGKPLGYEALARSSTPEFKGPLELIDAAVEVGKMGELGRLLRMLAVDGCTEYPLFLNVHPNEFAEGWLVRPDDPIFWHEHAVFMEITESVPLSNFAQVEGMLAEVRSKGVRLAIDDLGAGFSNLKYISDLSPDIVKVDRELIAGLTTDSRLFNLLKSIVQLCGQMGARVVAEGIETEAELAAVRAAHVQYGQGFLLARPAYPPPTIAWPG